MMFLMAFAVFCGFPILVTSVPPLLASHVQDVDPAALAAWQTPPKQRSAWSFRAAEKPQDHAMSFHDVNFAYEGNLSCKIRM